MIGKFVLIFFAGWIIFGIPTGWFARAFFDKREMQIKFELFIAFIFTILFVLIILATMIIPEYELVDAIQVLYMIVFIVGGVIGLTKTNGGPKEIIDTIKNNVPK